MMISKTRFKIQCPLCKNEDLKLKLQGVRDYEYNVKGTFDFYYCDVCNLLILSPLPTLEQLKDFYPPDYHGFYTTTRGRITAFLYRYLNSARFKYYESIVGKEGKVLDVGCADAAYFDEYKKVCPGHELWGVEFKDEIAEMGRRKGRNIITGTIHSLKKARFNLIIMNNLIEHVLDPIKELEKASELLNTGGHIILETPNIDSWDFQLFGKHWGGLHTPRHTYLFSRKSIGILVEKTGLEIVDENYQLNTDHWALSIQNRLQDSYLRCELTKGRTKYYPLLLFMFLQLNFIQKPLGKTGSMRVTLRLI